MRRGGHLSCSETCTGDDAERSFGTDEELREVGTCGLSSVTAGVDDRSVGEYDVEPDHDVLDLAVAIRQLTGATAGQPTTDGGERDRLWPMSDGQSEFRLKLFFEHVAECASSDIDDSRNRIDGTDSRQSAQIEDHATEEGDRTSHHSTAACGGGDRNAVLVAQAEDRCDLLDGGGFDDRGGDLSDLGTRCARHDERPPVAARFNSAFVAEFDRGSGPAQLRDQVGVDRDDRGVEMGSCRRSVKGDGWCRMGGHQWAIAASSSLIRAR